MSARRRAALLLATVGALAAAEPAGGKVGELDLETLRRAVADRPGDAAIGRTLFATQRCVQCHQLEEGRSGIGPNLGRIGQSRTRGDLVQDIVEPDAANAFGYDLRRFTLADGTSVIGSVMQNLPRKLQIAEPNGKVRGLNPDDIAEETTIPGSVMPRDLVKHLGVEQFAHLLAFLESQRGEDGGDATTAGDPRR